MDTPRPWMLQPEHGELTVRLLGGRRWRYDTTWAGAGRAVIRSDFSRLYMLEDGCGTVTTDAGAVPLAPGRVCLFPAGRAARYACREPMTLLWVHFRVEAIPGLDLFARHHPPPARPAAPRDWPDLRRL
ncbi:MAG: hypothetical protein ACOCX4_10710, partial [Planctomycetota bacterium]